MTDKNDSSAGPAAAADTSPTPSPVGGPTPDNLDRLRRLQESGG